MSHNTAKVKSQVTVQNLNQLCYVAGYRGVAGLARHIGRHRVTVWKAVRWPDQNGPTFNLISEALNASGN